MSCVPCLFHLRRLCRSRQSQSVYTLTPSQMLNPKEPSDGESRQWVIWSEWVSTVSECWVVKVDYISRLWDLRGWMWLAALWICLRQYFETQYTGKRGKKKWSNECITCMSLLSQSLPPTPALTKKSDWLNRSCRDLLIKFMMLTEIEAALNSTIHALHLPSQMLTHNCDDEDAGLENPTARFTWVPLTPRCSSQMSNPGSARQSTILLYVRVHVMH